MKPQKLISLICYLFCTLTVIYPIISFIRSIDSHTSSVEVAMAFMAVLSLVTFLLLLMMRARLWVWGVNVATVIACIAFCELSKGSKPFFELLACCFFLLLLAIFNSIVIIFARKKTECDTKRRKLPSLILAAFCFLALALYIPWLLISIIAPIDDIVALFIIFSIVPLLALMATLALLLRVRAPMWCWIVNAATIVTFAIYNAINGLDLMAGIIVMLLLAIFGCIAAIFAHKMTLRRAQAALPTEPAAPQEG